MTSTLLVYAAVLAMLQGAAPAGSEAAEVLEDDRYRFCHDDDYRLDRWEHQWCDLVGEPNEACPGLPAACQRPPREGGQLDGPGGGEGDCDGSGKGEGSAKPGGAGQGETDTGEPGGKDGKRAAPPPREPPPRRTVTIPTAMSGMAQVVFFVLIAAGLALLIGVLLKGRLTGRDDLEDAEPLVDESEAEPAREEASIVETDVQRLLKRARQAAARGDFDQAIADVYAAALRRLEGDGLLDLHSSHTNADHLRALRDHPELAATLRAIVGDVEQVQFGATRASASLFESLLARVLPLTARPLVALVLAVLATWLTPGLAWAGDMAGSFSSPAGSRAVVELLRRHDIDVSYRLDELDSMEEDVGVIVLLSDAELEDSHWQAARQWVRTGGVLVLAGVFPDDDDDWAIVNVATSSTATRLSGAWQFEDRLAGLDIQVPPGAALRVEPGGLEALPMLVRDGDDEPLYALHGSLGRGEIIALADDHLLTNIALAVGDNGEAILRILKGRGSIQLVTSWTGAGASSPFEAVHRARLTPFIAQLLLLLALLFLWKGVAFGKLRDPLDTTRRRFADHVRAVGLQYTRARASAHALSAYARWALERLRERVPRGRQSDLDELADKLAVRTGWTIDEITSLLRYAQAASDAGPATSHRPSSLRAGLEPTAQALSLNDADQRHLPMHVEQMQRLAQLIAALGRRRESS